MSGFGTTQIGQYGRMRTALEHEHGALRPTNGITIDWSTVTAAGSAVTLADGTQIAAGTKYLPLGRVLALITITEVQTLTVTGSPTGGTFTPTVPGYGATTAIAYNATAATLQTALEAVVGAGKVVASGSAGGPYTVTFDGTLGNIAQMTVATALTGGTSPGVTPATTSSGVAGFGKYGPYDSSATDGRQTLTPGRCFINNTLILEEDSRSDFPDAVYGGVARLALLTADATNPSASALRSAFPMLHLED